MFLEIIAGALLGWAFIRLAQKLGGDMRIYALGLVVAAAIYVGFAVAGGAPQPWTTIEVAGAVPFVVLAWLGLRYHPWWLAAGWAAHASWDTALHLVAGTPPFVPAWYPTVCLGFDFVVAIVIAMRARVSLPLATDAR